MNGNYFSTCLNYINPVDKKKEITAQLSREKRYLVLLSVEFIANNNIINFAY